MMGLNWGLLLALALAFGGGGYWAGDHNRNNAWLAKQGKQTTAQLQALQAEVQRSQTAASKAITEQQTLQTSYSTLERKFNELKLRGPFVVFVDRGGGFDAVGLPAGTVAAGEVGTAAAIPASAGVVGAADAAVGLSLGAVWMWNSALTGADTPAGACGAADPASAACAADSGLGVAHAWDNHAINAKSCATDRLRHQQLIDFVSALSPTVMNDLTTTKTTP